MAQFFNYEGFGTRERNYSQSVRIGNTIEISGQGGWDRFTEIISEDIGEEVDQTFKNIEIALQDAGGKGFEQVYKLRCYCAPLEGDVTKHIIRNMKAVMPNHKPLLTVVGVPNLALKGMHIEIEAAAHLA